MAILNGLFRIIKDSELRYSPEGDAVANVLMVYSYGTKKNEDGYLPSQFVEAAIFGKRAEGVNPYLTKGTKIFATIEDAHVRTFERKDGTQGATISGRIGVLEFAGSKSDSDAQEAPQQPVVRQQAPAPRQAAARPQQSTHSVAAMEDDSIPF
jgi:single-strand DNA-binding protein